MYYYNNELINLDVEDLILDYLMYRKTKANKRNYQIQSQYEIGKGWPHYKNLKLDTDLFNDDAQLSALSRETDWTVHISEHSKRLLLYIEKELSEYDRNPLRNMDRETLAHITDKILMETQKEQGSLSQMFHHETGDMKHQVLRLLIESLLAQAVFKTN